jgi:hypothetical protein
MDWDKDAELAREILREGDDPIRVQLADALLKAIALIKKLQITFDPVAARFAQPGHKYPELAQAGLSHLWKGPGWNDFDKEMILACIKHLKEHNLPNQLGNATDYIRNRIKQQDWGALEQRWSEAQANRQRRTAPRPKPPPIAESQVAPTEPAQNLTPTAQRPLPTARGFGKCSKTRGSPKQNHETNH